MKNSGNGSGIMPLNFQPNPHLLAKKLRWTGGAA